MALPKPSSALMRECKRMKLPTPMHKVFCELIVAGWDKFDAYGFSGLWNPSYSTLMNQQDAERLLTDNKAVIEYIDSRIKEIENAKKRAKKAAIEAEKAEAIQEIDMATELSKEMQLKELLIAKGKHAVGSKEWLDIKKLIADLSKIKQDELKDEDDFVHFYVPLQCHQCDLYLKEKTRQKRKSGD